MKTIALPCVCILFACGAAWGQDSFVLRSVSEYWDYFPDWSPDGEKIVFSSSRDTHPALSLFTVEVKSGTIEALTRNEVGAGAAFPQWSPDGTQIAYTSDQGGNTDVYIIESDGSDVRNLTRTPFDEGGRIDWSPDGERIVFTSERDGGSGLYTMRADGSDVRRLRDFRGDVIEPSWSPSGNRIAISSNRGGNWEIYSIATDGSDLRRLTYHWAWDGHPSWSPDGKQIAFWSDRDDFWFEIYLMAADGANVRRLTRSLDWDLGPAWSPDGTRIAWHSARGRYGIDVLDVDGSGRHRLTSSEASDFARVVREDGVDAALRAHGEMTKQGPGAAYLYEEEIWVLSEELIAKGDVAGAIELGEFHLAQIAGPTMKPYAYEGLGRIYRAAGRTAPPGFAEFFDLIRTRGVEHALMIFEEVEREFPDWQMFSQFRMNRLGYEYLERGWIEEAIVLFEMNVAAYPDSPNAYDSLAEAHWRSGDRKCAAGLYEKVREMDPDGPVGSHASQILQRLRDAEETFSTPGL